MPAAMSGLVWGEAEQARLEAIRDDLAKVSTASACQLLIGHGWRNATMVGIRPLFPLGLGQRLVGRARTCRYLPRREAETPIPPETLRNSPERVLMESLQPGDIICFDALGVTTAGVMGDIYAARIQARGAIAAMVHGAVRDAPFIREVGLPVFANTTHPSHSGRDLVPVDHDQPINMGGAQVLPGDIILADDEGALAMPLHLAEEIAAHGPEKELLEAWIRGKVVAGGSLHDYYPPNQETKQAYVAERGKSAT